MLESIVASVLNNYIGEYLQLNTDQFSIAFPQGQVDLTNVPIKKQALRKFDNPIQVKNGIIGKLQLQVPLLSRFSPWEQLLAQIGTQFMEEFGQETAHWWGASLHSTISNNIQVRIENIQIKYECMEYEFGIKIQSLSIETTNAQWRPGFIEVSEGANIFKKFDIKGFPIYLYTDGKWRPILAALDSPKEWWRFAIGRVLDEIHSQNYNLNLVRNLEGKLKTANPNASIFIPKLSLPNASKTENTTTLIKQIEHGDDFSYQDLRILREAVFNKLSQELKNIEEENAENHSLKGDDSPFEIIPKTSGGNNEKEHPLMKNIERDNSNIEQHLQTVLQLVGGDGPGTSNANSWERPAPPKKAFTFFALAKKEELRIDEGNFAKVCHMVRPIYNAKSDEEKAPYFEMEKNDEKRYALELKEYEDYHAKTLIHIVGLEQFELTEFYKQTEIWTKLLKMNNLKVKKDSKAWAEIKEAIIRDCGDQPLNLDECAFWLKNWEEKCAFGSFLTLEDGFMTTPEVFSSVIEIICRGNPECQYFTQIEIDNYALTFKMPDLFQLAQTKIIFAPLMFANHTTLAYFDIKNCIFNVYDSQLAPRTELTKAKMSLTLFAMIESMAKNQDYVIKKPKEDWSRNVASEDAPQQKTNVDCLIFALTCALMISNGQQITKNSFGQANIPFMRRLFAQMLTEGLIQ